MIASDTSDALTSVAFVIGAVAALVLVLMVPWVVRKLTLKFGKLEATVDTIHQATNGVDKENGEKPLIDKVRSLETGMAATNEKLDDHMQTTAEFQEYVRGQLKVLVAVAGRVSGLTASASPEASPPADGL